MKGVAASRPSVILLRASVIVWPRRPRASMACRQKG